MVALIGMLVLMGADYRFSREYFKGDIVCFVAMLLFALYLVMGRRNRHIASLWLYLVPLYYVASLFLVAGASLALSGAKVEE